MQTLANSIGNLVGFGGPYLIGWVREVTGYLDRVAGVRGTCR
jgi:hypothetical protein